MMVDLLSHREPHKEFDAQACLPSSAYQLALDPISSSSQTRSPTSPKLAAKNLPGLSTLAPNISIEYLIPDTLLSFRRLISLLLPIRYPDKFFSEIVSDPTVSALSRVAVWHDRPRPGKRKRSTDENEDAIGQGARGTVVGGIRCRLEPIPVHPDASPPMQQQLYIQAIALLSPYRSQGIATGLVDMIIEEVLGMNHNVTSIYAHVWESNEVALDWYSRRGFTAEEGVLQGYYRRLKPGGARIVRRTIGVKDYLKKTAVQEKQHDGYK